MGKGRATPKRPTGPADAISTHPPIPDEIMNGIEAKIEAAVERAVASAMRSFHEEVEALKKENEVLKTTIRDLEQKAELKVDDLEQYQRRQNIRIFGVPEQSQESTDIIALKLFKEKLKIDVKLEDIDRSHRVGRRQQGLPGSDRGRHRPIIVKFRSYRDRQRVFEAKKLLKGTPVTIKEDLTAHRLKLLNAAMDRFGVRNVWSFDGRVKFVTNNGGNRRVHTVERLAELADIKVLRKNRTEDESCDWGRYGAINQAIDIELDEDAGYMENLFREVHQVRTWIDDIKSQVTEMKQIHDQLLLLPRPDEQMKQRLEDKTENVKQIAKYVNRHLKSMEQRIKNDESSNSSDKAIFRIRKTQYMTLLHLFVEAVTQFNLQQVYYKEKFEKRVQRVISLAKAQISDEKLEELLEQGDYSTIFNGDIITETKRAQKVLEVVHRRQEELLKLEKSIIELSNLFSEMAMLVDQQGDMINNIERHVVEAEEYVEYAKHETRKAFQYKEKARKLKLILFASAILIVLLLIIWTSYKFYPRETK